jgi:hypothetical protein
MPKRPPPVNRWRRFGCTPRRYSDR